MNTKSKKRYLLSSAGALLIATSAVGVYALQQNGKATPRVSRTDDGRICGALDRGDRVLIAFADGQIVRQHEPGAVDDDAGADRCNRG